MKLRKSIPAALIGGALVAGAIGFGPTVASSIGSEPTKQEQKASAVVPTTQLSGGSATISSASVREPRKLCEYESPQGCVGWYPNVNTCRDISNHGTPAQIRACLVWSGFGSRG